MTVGGETHIMRVVFTACCVIGVVAVCHGVTHRREWREVAGAIIVVAAAVFWASALFSAGWL